MNQSTTIPERPWWATTTEDMRLDDDLVIAADDPAWEHRAVRYNVEGASTINAGGTGAQVSVMQMLDRTGSVVLPPHVEVLAEDGRLDALGARTLARYLEAAAAVLDAIEGVR